MNFSAMIAVASGKLFSFSHLSKIGGESQYVFGASPDIRGKVREIHRLAHDVKERLKINLIGL